MTIEKGQYIAVDEPKFRGKGSYKKLEYYKGAKYIPAHVHKAHTETGHYLGGSGIGKYTKKVPKEKVKARIRPDGYVTEYLLNWIRVPSEEAQKFIKKNDEEQIRLKQERHDYLHEHFIEWRLAEPEDFVQGTIEDCLYSAEGNQKH